MNIFSWIHIILAVLIYVVIALVTSIIIKNIGGDLKEMKSRSSQPIIITGAISNILILGIILLLLVLVDQSSINALGIFLSGKGVIFINISVIAIFLLAVIYLNILKATGTIQIKPGSPADSISELLFMSEATVVLLIVAVQEEVLFRGYITINLISYSPVVIIIVSTILFTAVHVLTNKVTVYQLISWFLGGAVFSYAYLVTGTIWIPIILHFATDLINVFIFNIIGKYSIFTFSPPIRGKQRAFYRIIYTIIIVMILTGFYGAL